MRTGIVAGITDAAVFLQVVAFSSCAVTAALVQLPLADAGKLFSLPWLDADPLTVVILIEKLSHGFLASGLTVNCTICWLLAVCLVPAWSSTRSVSVISYAVSLATGFIVQLVRAPSVLAAGVSVAGVGSDAICGLGVQATIDNAAVTEPTFLDIMLG